MARCYLKGFPEGRFGGAEVTDRARELILSAAGGVVEIGEACRLGHSEEDIVERVEGDDARPGFHPAFAFELLLGGIGGIQRRMLCRHCVEQRRGCPASSSAARYLATVPAKICMDRIIRDWLLRAAAMSFAPNSFRTPRLFGKAFRTK